MKNILFKIISFCFISTSLWSQNSAAILKDDKNPALTYSTGLGFQQWVSARQAQQIRFIGFELKIPAYALNSDKILSINALQNKEIAPLNPDLVNVTRYFAAYRLLPQEIAFDKAVQLRLEYDESLIPQGFTPQDIRTFYFDEIQKQWVALEKDTTLTNQHSIISYTNKPKDFINGIIKVPESPKTAAYTPNSIKDIKAQDPSANIVTIAPPTANLMGAATTGFPIKLPAGRGGMQPNLNIQYNSGGGNDWLGLGWNLHVPSIGVETRWGVPRYDAALETETYTMGGEQLTPVAHRNEWIGRNTNSQKQFFPRIEGAFNKIIRHGNNPQNYLWEVISKDGTHQFYGGKNGVIDNNAVLKDGSGNIAQWNLVETRDANDNFVQYEYTLVEDVGLPNGTVMGYQTYLTKITYTGHGNVAGEYTVDLIRDRDLNEPRRKDVSINARLGFKQVSADLLRKVVVRFQNQLIRSYDLDYKEGAFYKTLLGAITERDKNGVVFYKHDFDYYDEVRQNGTYKPFKPIINWNTMYDNVKGDSWNPIQLFNRDFSGNASALGGSKSGNFNLGIALTFGLADGNYLAKSSTIGGNFGYSEANNEGLLALVDIDGDRLPDKVFKHPNGELVYRRNLSSPSNGFGMMAFDQQYHKLVGIQQFSISKTNTVTIGAEVHVGPVFAGYSYANSHTTTETYLTDFNADGLMDVVVKGVVHFNKGIGADQNIYFETTSQNTPNPISPTPADTSLIRIDPLAQEKMIDSFPLHDVVRMWAAPYAGAISINAPVRLIENTSNVSQDYPYKDGVRVTIQRNGTELWAYRIPANNYGVVTPDVSRVDSIQVQPGDRIYFRVQSVVDGAYDQVFWQPVISYRNQSLTETDANRKKVYQFDIAKDYLLKAALSAPQSVSMPLKGTIRMEGLFKKPITSDDLELAVLKLRRSGSRNVMETVFSRLYAWNAVADEQIGETIRVDSTDELIFALRSATNVDWTALTWQPRIYYTSADNNTTVLSTTGSPIYQFLPAASCEILANAVQKPEGFVAPTTGICQVAPLLGVDVFSGGNFSITLSLKGKNKLYDKKTYHVVNGILPTVLPALSANVFGGDSLFVEYYVLDLDSLLRNITRIDAQVRISGNLVTATVGVFTRIHPEATIFGTLYRGWGQFAYNGNREKANIPIIESDLKLERTDVPNPLPDRQENIGNSYNLSKSKFIYLIASPDKQAWTGLDRWTFLKADTISSSRMGEDDIVLRNPIGTGLTLPNKNSFSHAHSVSGGAIAGGSYTDNKTGNSLDMMDLNGDNYVDIITEHKIQYTLPQGRFEATARSLAGGSHQAKSNAVGVTVGGGFAVSNVSNSGSSAGAGANKMSVRVGSTIDLTNGNAAESFKKAAAGIGLSGSASFSKNWDHTTFTYLDINGDGLQDRVYDNGQVALNLGYEFAPLEAWGYETIRSGESEDYGSGLGISLWDGSFSAGVSLSFSENHSTKGLQDVNGDGLIDIVDNNTVKLNLGSRFSEAIAWPIGKLDEGSSTGESINFSFTVAIMFPIPPIKFCVNPNASFGRGVSRPKRQLTDINGDGFPDLLSSDANDGDLKVQTSTIGKTNLLKTVHRPLGASFTMDYVRVGSTYDLPNEKWVLDKVTLFDGLIGDGADTIKTRFEYENGQYNRHEKEFYGFKTVKTHHLDTKNQDAIYKTVIQVYNNLNYYEKGLLITEWLQDAQGRKFSETQNIYALKNLDGLTVSPNFVLQSNDSSSVYPALVETKTFFYEGQPAAGLQHRVTFEYDKIGNVTRYTDFGDNSRDDWVEANIKYHPNRTILDEPSEISVQTAQGLMRKRQTDMDATGNILQIRQYLKDGSFAQYDMTYDEYGNLTKVMHPQNYQNKRFSYSYLYDNQVHSYVTEVTDAYGYRSKSSYEYLFGQVLETTDLNNQKIKYAIDEVGRIQTITAPYELAAGKPYTIAFEYYPEANVPYAITKHFDNEHLTDIETITFIDGLSRPVQVKKTAALFTRAGAADEIRWIVSGKNRYDAFGRVLESYYPVTESVGNATLLNPNGNAIQPSRVTYDILDRPLTKTLPDNTVTRYQYEIGADNLGQIGFKTTVFDALNRSKENYTDIRKRSKAVKDQSNVGAIWTNFTYNALSELLQVTDNQQNAIKYTYDHLGRKLSVQHPDAGLTALKYDLANNLLEKVTEDIRQKIPNGGAIRYEYDYERLVTVHYPRHFQNKVQYSYGKTGDLYNRAGRIVLQQDASGGQEFYYGALGEVVKNIRTIYVNENQLQTFITQFEYDTWNRLKTMTYPDDEKLTYRYNRAGKLQSLSGAKSGHTYIYVSQLGYDDYEQRVFLKYGNGTTSEYAYEPTRRRLSHLNVQGGTGIPFIKNAYTYDAVQNILSIQNTAPAQPGQLGGAMTHRFEYDDLYRLSKASGDWHGNQKTDTYSLEMQYDDLHNIRSKAQTHQQNGLANVRNTYLQTYQYAGNRPHVPIKIGENDYQYDKNGNLTDTKSENPMVRYHRELTWDEENRLMGVAENGSVSQYTYDADGERVIKSHGAIQGVFINGAPAGAIRHAEDYTLYVNPYLVVKENTFTKHYYIEGQRITSKVGTGAFAKDWQKSLLKAGDIDFVGRMRQLADTAQAFYRRLGYPPGAPTRPYMYAHPDSTGIPIPAVVGASPTSAFWPVRIPLRPAAGDVPGQPIRDTSVNREQLGAGYGYLDRNKWVESNQFFYHPDHLGSSNYITDANGIVRQHEEYFPFGESLVDESLDEKQPYLFNAKELDIETGLYYYGARYYDPKTAIWASVDPMAEKYPNWSPYNYTLQNPIVFIDPDGKMPHILATTLIGAGIGGSIELGRQLYNGKFDAAALTGSVIQGGITGAVAGATGGLGLLANVGANASANVVGGVVNNTIQGKEVTLGSVATDALVGGVAGSVNWGVAQYREGAKVVAEVTKAAEAAEATKLTAEAVKTVGKRTLEQEASILVKQNSGKARVSMRSSNSQMDVDLTGKAHAGIPTPHTKISPRNHQAPAHLQPAYNTTTGKTTLRGSTIDDIRTVRRFLRSESRRNHD